MRNKGEIPNNKGGMVHVNLITKAGGGYELQRARKEPFYRKNKKSNIGDR